MAKSNTELVQMTMYCIQSAFSWYAVVLCVVQSIILVVNHRKSYLDPLHDANLIQMHTSPKTWHVAKETMSIWYHWRKTFAVTLLKVAKIEFWMRTQFDGYEHYWLDKVCWIKTWYGFWKFGLQHNKCITFFIVLCWVFGVILWHIQTLIHFCE